MVTTRLSGTSTCRCVTRTLLAGFLVAAFLLATFAYAGAGYLGPGDEQLNSGDYYDRVSFNGSAGDVVLIEIQSTQFDPFVLVLDANDNVLAQQDDGPGVVTDVRLEFALPASGSYSIIITSAFPGETGGYSLSLSAPGQATAKGTGPVAPQTPPGATAR